MCCLNSSPCWFSSAIVASIWYALHRAHARGAIPQSPNGVPFFSLRLLNSNAPQLLWLGNGEAKPVRIQFYLDNNEVGSAIEIDHLGKINEI